MKAPFPPPTKPTLRGLLDISLNPVLFAVLNRFFALMDLRSRLDCDPRLMDQSNYWQLPFKVFVVYGMARQLGRASPGREGRACPASDATRLEWTRAPIL